MRREGRARGDGILFRSTFETPESVAAQGVLLVGAPAVDRGITLDGSTQYGTLGTGGRQLEVNPSKGIWAKVVFSPDFAYDEDVLRFFFADNGSVGSTLALGLYKHNTANSHALVFSTGAGSVYCTGANYSAYWNQGQRNTLIACQAGASCLKMWLNGNALTVATAAMTTVAWSEWLNIGRSASYSSYFDGVIHELTIGQGILTDEDAAELYDETEASDLRPENSLIYLPCFRQQGVGSAGDPWKTPNLGSLGSACDALLGSDGQTAASKPTILSPRGFSFDGGDYLTIPDNAALSFGDGAGNDEPFSVVIHARVDGTIGSPDPLICKGWIAVAGREWAAYFQGGGYLYFLLADVDDDYIIATSAAGDVVQGHDYVVVATYDGSGHENGLTLYLDGEDVTTTRTHSGTYNGMTPGSEPVNVMGKSGVGITTGKAKAAAIYPFELSPRQVARLTAEWRQRMQVAA